MNLIEKFNETINLSDDIQSASFLNENKLAILTRTGEVILYSMKTKEQEKLFETNPENGILYSDGGFDPNAQSSIYTMDDIIVVVNDYKKHGFVLNLKENYLRNFNREDYHADISKYPIALFNRGGDPHLIFGAAWNKIQIANLTTLQILTADKSLIGENAEQRQIDLFKIYGQDNKQFWPNEFDYFFGGLILSPNGKQFLSAGLAWGSFDTCYLFDIEDFISNHRIKAMHLGEWTHANRGICFVDDVTVAVLYNPCAEDDAVKDTPYEIRLYDTNGKGQKGIIKLPTLLNLDGALLFYQQTARQFYTFSSEIGLVVLSAMGEFVFHSPDFCPLQYDVRYDRFICHKKKQLAVYQIK